MKGRDLRELRLYGVGNARICDELNRIVLMIGPPSILGGIWIGFDFKLGGLGHDGFGGVAEGAVSYVVKEGRQASDLPKSLSCGGLLKWIRPENRIKAKTC